MSSGTSTLESIALVALNELQRLSEGPENGDGRPIVVGVPIVRDPHEWKYGNNDDGAIASMGEAGTSPPDVGEAGRNETATRGRDDDVVPAPRIVSLEGTPARDDADTITTTHPTDAVATLPESETTESVSSPFHGLGHQGIGQPEVDMPTTGLTGPEANDPHTDGATVATLPSSDGTGTTVVAPAFSVSSTTGTAGPTDTSGDGAPYESEFDTTSTADFSHILADPEAWLRSTENLYAALPPVDTKQHIPKVLADDVLCGRGGETNHHPGNVQYRSLVKAFQKLYIESKRRDKPKIAQCIVFTIRQVGGRFLKRTDPGANAWVDVGNTKAREKTSQALREGAPDLRGNEPSQHQDQESATASTDSGDDEAPNPSAMAGGFSHPSHSNSFDSSATSGGKGTAGGPPPTLPHTVHGVGGPNPTPVTDVAMAVTMSERVAASLLQNPLFHRLSPFQQQQVLMSELAAARQQEHLHGFHSLGHGGHPVASSALTFPQHQLNHHRGFHDFATNEDIKLNGTPKTVHPSLDALYEEVLAAKLAIRKAAAETVGASSVPTTSNGSVATFPSLAGVGNLLKRPAPASPYSTASSSSPLRWNGTDGGATAAAGAAVIVSDSDGSVGSSLSSPSGNSTSSGGPRLKRLKMRRQQEVPAAVTSLQ